MDDPEVAENFIYWFFANRFGYTPDQVDVLPYDRMCYMKEIEMEFKKKVGAELGK